MRDFRSYGTKSCMSSRRIMSPYACNLYIPYAAEIDLGGNEYPLKNYHNGNFETPELSTPSSRQST